MTLPHPTIRCNYKVMVLPEPLLWCALMVDGLTSGALLWAKDRRDMEQSPGLCGRAVLVGAGDGMTGGS